MSKKQKKTLKTIKKKVVVATFLRGSSISVSTYQKTSVVPII